MLTGFKEVQCVCGKPLDQWEGGGSYISASLQQSSFKCPDCNRTASIIRASGANILLMAEEDEALGQEVFDWMNTHVLRQWRAWRHARDQSKNPKEIDLPYPPKIPEGVFVFMVRNEGLEQVNRLDTLHLPTPKDPIRTQHDEFWRGVIEELEDKEKRGITVEEIQNRYYSDRLNNEPWFSFEIGPTKFVMGPRKRVFSIQCEVSKKADEIKVAEIQATTMKVFEKVVEGDNTTNKFNYPASVMVHAWGRDKLIQYLTYMIQAAKKLEVV